MISKTADGLINDIDRHYAEILKEREAELIAAEPAMAMERLYAVDDRYLHVSARTPVWTTRFTIRHP